MPDDAPQSLMLYQADTARKCGACQLCCKLLPMSEMGKPANVRCRHQRFKIGCTIYANRPTQCRYWSCRWLLGNDTADIPRPDRAHYVIDPIPDFVRMVNNETGELQVNIEVVQVWLDPDYPDAHEDPALRRYILRRATEGTATLIRLNGGDAFAIFAPPLTGDGTWRVMRGGTVERQHSIVDYFAAQIENEAIAKHNQEQSKC